MNERSEIKNGAKQKNADFKTALELLKESKRKNVVNIDKLMHDNAFFHRGQTKIKFNVSPSAVQEYSSRIIDNIGDNTPILCEIAQKHGRKTVMEQDVIELFGFVDRNVI